MENLGKITLFAIIMVGAFFTSLLGAKVVLSIADLYQLSFITKFSFIQLFGLISIIHILKYKHKKEEPQGDFTDVAINTSSSILSTVIFLLVSWGLSFVTYYAIS